MSHFSGLQDLMNGGGVQFWNSGQGFGLSMGGKGCGES